MKTIVTEMTNTLEGITSSLDDSEDRVSHLENKVTENIQSEHQKEKEILKM